MKLNLGLRLAHLHGLHGQEFSARHVTTPARAVDLAAFSAWSAHLT